jgi:hypothetical protein
MKISIIVFYDNIIDLIKFLRISKHALNGYLFEIIILSKISITNYLEGEDNIKNVIVESYDFYNSIKYIIDSATGAIITIITNIKLFNFINYEEALRMLMIQHDDDIKKQALLYKSINDGILNNINIDGSNGKNIEYLFFYKVLFIKNKQLLQKEDNFIKSLNDLNYEIINPSLII